MLPQLTLQPVVRAGPVPVTSVDPQWGVLWSLSFARERGLARPGLPPAYPALELGGWGGGVLPESLPLVLRARQRDGDRDRAAELASSEHFSCMPLPKVEGLDIYLPSALPVY